MRLANAGARQPFDLSRGPLIRCMLLRLGTAEHMLLLTMHHIVFDGWSIAVLLDELTRLYRAYRSSSDSPLAELPHQYADYAIWQREWLEGEALEEQLAYWRQQLAAAPEALISRQINHDRRCRASTARPDRSDCLRLSSLRSRRWPKSKGRHCLWRCCPPSSPAFALFRTDRCDGRSRRGEPQSRRD